MKSEWQKAKKVGILMALPMESQGLFEKYNLPIHYSGVGKINAAQKAMELILHFKYDALLNLGTAGSCRFKSHSIVECVGFVQRDMDLTPLGIPKGVTALDSIPGEIAIESISTLKHRGVCGSGDSFEVGPPQVPCDLVDMEAYAFAKVCRRMNLPFASIKYITDGADHVAHNDWVENLKPASEALVEFALGFEFLNKKY